jgi:ketosteroid isomerase-like protein
MRTVFSPHTTFLTMLALLFGVFASISVKADPLEDQVKASYSAWDAAFNKSDAKAVAAFYVNDALVLPAGHDVVKGSDGIEKFFAGLFANGVTGHKLDLIEAHGNGNLFVGTARWSAKGKDAQGKPASFGGLATHVFEKQPDGSVKLRVHIFNTN